MFCPLQIRYKLCSFRMGRRKRSHTLRDGNLFTTVVNVGLNLCGVPAYWSCPLLFIRIWQNLGYPLLGSRCFEFQPPPSHVSVLVQARKSLTKLPPCCVQLPKSQLRGTRQLSYQLLHGFFFKWHCNRSWIRYEPDSLCIWSKESCQRWSPRSSCWCWLILSNWLRSNFKFGHMQQILLLWSPSP